MAKFNLMAYANKQRAIFKLINRHCLKGHFMGKAWQAPQPASYMAINANSIGYYAAQLYYGGCHSWLNCCIIASLICMGRISRRQIANAYNNYAY